MPKSLNRVELIGNLTKDASTKFTQSGTAVTRLTIATNRSWKDKKTNEWVEESDFHNCVLWASENLANYLVKGKKIFIAGRLQTRKYEKDNITHYSTEVVIDDVILLDGGGTKKEGGEHKQAERTRQGASQPSGDGWGDSDWGGGGIDDDPNSVPF